MPAHVYVQVGDYQAALRCSLRAVEANTKLVRLGANTPFYSGYVLHDYHMLVYAAMLAADEGEWYAVVRCEMCCVVKLADIITVLSCLNLRYNHKIKS